MALKHPAGIGASILDRERGPIELHGGSLGLGTIVSGRLAWTGPTHWLSTLSVPMAGWDWGPEEWNLSGAGKAEQSLGQGDKTTGPCRMWKLPTWPSLKVPARLNLSDLNTTF